MKLRPSWLSWQPLHQEECSCRGYERLCSKVYGHSTCMLVFTDQSTPSDILQSCGCIYNWVFNVCLEYLMYWSQTRDFKPNACPSVQNLLLLQPSAHKAAPPLQMLIPNQTHSCPQGLIAHQHVCQDQRILLSTITKPSSKQSSHVCNTGKLWSMLTLPLPTQEAQRTFLKVKFLLNVTPRLGGLCQVNTLVLP